MNPSGCIRKAPAAAPSATVPAVEPPPPPATARQTCPAGMIVNSPLVVGDPNMVLTFASESNFSLIALTISPPVMDTLSINAGVCDVP
jgi:hypothetical protein